MIPAPAPRTPTELAEYRYDEIVKVVRAQNQALADFARYLADWQSNSESLRDAVATFTEHQDALEAAVNALGAPIPQDNEIGELRGEIRDLHHDIEDLWNLVEALAIAARLPGAKDMPGGDLESIESWTESLRAAGEERRFARLRAHWVRACRAARDAQNSRAQVHGEDTVSPR